MADKPLTAAELREGVGLVQELLQRLGTPPGEFGDDLLNWCQQLGHVHAHLKGLRDPDPLHARSALTVLRREVTEAGGWP